MQCGAGGLARGSRIEGGIGADRVAPLSSGGPVEQRPALVTLVRDSQRERREGRIEILKPTLGGRRDALDKRSVSFFLGMAAALAEISRAGGCSWWGVSG